MTAVRIRIYLELGSLDRTVPAGRIRKVGFEELVLDSNVFGLMKFRLDWTGGTVAL